MSEYSKEVVGRRLKSGLIDKGMTVKDLADAIGMSEYAVKEWCGGRSGMTLENAIKVCDALGWPLDRLAVRNGNER